MAENLGFPGPELSKNFNFATGFDSGISSLKVQICIEHPLSAEEVSIEPFLGLIDYLLATCKH